MQLDLLHLLAAATIALCAGLLGGIAGIGGSLVMLPGLGYFLGYEGPEQNRHHLYMASAMVINVVVSIPAAMQHHKKASIRLDIFRTIAPVMCITMVLGVLISDRLRGARLIDLLAIFIGIYALSNLVRAVRNAPDTGPDSERTRTLHLIPIGAITGLAGGVLGIGGGILMVPMLQLFCRVPLRQAIGTSSAIMCITAVVGSASKLWSLPDHHLLVSDALTLAAAMAPTAILGAVVGARLAHALPLNSVRVIISILLALAAARMAFSHPGPAPVPATVKP